MTTSASVREGLFLPRPLPPTCRMASSHESPGQGTESWTHARCHFDTSRELETHHFQTAPDQLHLFVTLIFLEEENPSEELNDIVSDTWTERQFIAKETVLLGRNIIIISSPKKVSIHLYFLFTSGRPKPASLPFPVCSKKPSFSKSPKVIRPTRVLRLENSDF